MLDFVSLPNVDRGGGVTLIFEGAWNRKTWWKNSMPDSCGRFVGRRVPVLLELVHLTGEYRFNATLRKIADRVGEEVEWMKGSTGGRGCWEEEKWERRRGDGCGGSACFDGLDCC